MKTLLLIFLIILSSSWSNAQNETIHNPKLVGGPCEGCDAIFEYGDKILSPIDTLPDYQNNGQKIKISGTVYNVDGTTPAKNVIIYIYHTNQKGIYANKFNASNWERRHGYIRGWIKTGSDGRYTFFTLKPGIYPNRSVPAHIHITVLEPNGKYYWLNSYHFSGDDLLTGKETNPKSPRGGDAGLLTLKKEGNVWVGTRDIILGKNVHDYE